MDLITIDWETYYSRKQKYSLSSMTTREYIEDKRFQEIGFSVKLNDAPTEWFTGSDAYLAKVIRELPWERAIMLAHNCAFDGGILKFVHGIQPAMYACTVSMARPYFGVSVGASLAAVARALGIGEKGTEVVLADGKRREDFTDWEMRNYGAYCDKDVDLCHRIFKLILQGGTAPSGITLPAMRRDELALVHETISMFCDPRLVLDKPMLEEYSNTLEERQAQAIRDAITSAARSNPKVMLEVHKALKAKKTLRQLIGSNNMFADCLRQCGVEPPLKTSPTTGKATYAFAKTDKAMEELQTHENETVRLLASARVKTKSSIEESRVARLITQAAFGELAVPLSYCGAGQTWRWSGYDKLNMQNLPKKGVIRRAIRARPGEKLVVADSSNIELRVNHTLAGQAESVELFHKGADLYCHFASTLYGFEVIKGVHDSERQLGKLSHLSLGYNCGWRQFQHICRLNGVRLTDEEAKSIVSTWRSTYSAIPALWKRAGFCLNAIAHGLEQEIGTGGLVRTAKDKLITAPDHYIRFPNLRRELIVEDNEIKWVYDGRNKKRIAIYGGKVVENICQHLARNILAHQQLQISRMLRTHFPGWRICALVHDEFVMAGPGHEAEHVLASVLPIMHASPSWWPDIPLAAEGSVGVTYADAK